MKAQAIGEELLALEKQFWDAMKSRDSSTATRLSDDPCVVITSQGVGEIDKKTLTGMVESGAYQLKEYSFDEKDVHVRSITDDVAVVAYKVREELLIDGKPTTMEAYDASVWVRRDGNWVCALHTETVAGDPYGRR